MNELLDRLEASGKVTSLSKNGCLYILSKVNGTSRLYSFVVHKGEPIVTRITDEKIVESLLNE